MSPSTNVAEAAKFWFDPFSQKDSELITARQATAINNEPLVVLVKKITNGYTFIIVNLTAIQF